VWRVSPLSLSIDQSMGSLSNVMSSIIVIEIVFRYRQTKKKCLVNRNGLDRFCDWVIDDGVQECELAKFACCKPELCGFRWHSYKIPKRCCGLIRKNQQTTFGSDCSTSPPPR
jgi:hypothetical protein